MAAPDAADNLSEELKGMLLGGKIREAEAAVGLNNANGSEEGEVEALGDSLSADDEVDFPVSHLVV